MLIVDTKKPGKAPFEIGEKGFQGLQNKWPGRYVIAGGAVKVTPMGIEKIQVTPVKNVGKKPPIKKS